MAMNWVRYEQGILSEEYASCIRDFGASAVAPGIPRPTEISDKVQKLREFLDTSSGEILILCESKLKAEMLPAQLHEISFGLSFLVGTFAELETHVFLVGTFAELETHVFLVGTFAELETHVFDKMKKLQSIVCFDIPKTAEAVVRVKNFAEKLKCTTSIMFNPVDTAHNAIIERYDKLQAAKSKSRSVEPTRTDLFITHRKFQDSLPEEEAPRIPRSLYSWRDNPKVAFYEYCEMNDLELPETSAPSKRTKGLEVKVVFKIRNTDISAHGFGRSKKDAEKAAFAELCKIFIEPAKRKCQWEFGKTRCEDLSLLKQSSKINKILDELVNTIYPTPSGKSKEREKVKSLAHERLFKKKEDSRDLAACKDKPESACLESSRESFLGSIPRLESKEDRVRTFNARVQVLIEKDRADIKNSISRGHIGKTVMITRETGFADTEYVVNVYDWIDLHTVDEKYVYADSILVMQLPTSDYFIITLAKLQMKLNAQLVMPWNLIDDCDLQEFLEKYTKALEALKISVKSLEDSMICFGITAMLVKKKLTDFSSDRVYMIPYFSEEFKKLKNLPFLNGIFCFDLPVDDYSRSKLIESVSTHRAQIILRVDPFKDAEVDYLRAFLAQISAFSRISPSTSLCLELVSRCPKCS